MLDTLFTGIWYTVEGKVTNYSALYYFYCTFIGDFDIFPLISQSDFVSINLLTLILENICQCDIKHIMTDKNNDVSSEGLDLR
jgi:hypothetical protein